MKLYDTVIITKDFPDQEVKAGMVGVWMDIAISPHSWAYMVEIKDHPLVVVDIPPPYVEPYNRNLSQLGPKGIVSMSPNSAIHEWWDHVFDRPVDPNDRWIPDTPGDQSFEWIMKDLKRRALHAKSLGIPIPQHIQDVTGVTDDGKR